MSIVNIPDLNLKTAINYALDPTRDPGRDILVSEIESLTALMANNKGIKDLTGLENASKLISLLISDNQISNISALGNLKNLYELCLDNNEICDISQLSGLNYLGSVNLSNNKISDISSLSSLRTIRWLDLSNNQISDLSPLNDNLYSMILLNNQKVKITGQWENGTLVFSTIFLKNTDGTSISVIRNITPSTGVYDNIAKTITWENISYFTEASFTFEGADNFNGTVKRIQINGPKAIQLQLSVDAPITIKYKAPVIFNKRIFTGFGIDYNDTTGVITINSVGVYNFEWWISGVDLIKRAIFALEIDGKSTIVGNCGIISGQIRGNGFIEVIKAPMNIRLINISTVRGVTASVGISTNTPVQASININSIYVIQDNYRN